MSETVRQQLEREEGKAHVSFADWIAEARHYAIGYFGPGSDGELGDDEDMRPFYDDAYGWQEAVDEVFRDGAS